MPHDIFISYSHIDKPIADAICANLEVAGIRCWIAPRDMTPGEDWPSAIARAIPQSRVMVMVFSSHSNNSEQVYRELFLAAENNVIISPFKIEEAELEPRIGYFLAGTHWLDAMNPPTQEQIDTLVQCVKSLLLTPPPPRPIPAKRLPAWAWGIMIAVLLLAGGAAFLCERGQSTNAIPLPSPASSQTNQLGILATRVPVDTSVSTPTDTPEIINTVDLGPLSGQARTFAEPILNIVAPHKPDFEDNFSKANPDWWFNPMQGGVISEGVARLKVNNGDEGMENKKALTGKDFVMQFDARPVSGETQMNIDLVVHYISPGHFFSLEIFPASRSWDVGSDWANDGGFRVQDITNAISPIGRTTQITVIAKGSRFALYLNQTPAGFFENKNFDNAGGTQFHCVSFSPAVCEFDNIKFWNLANVPGLP